MEIIKRDQTRVEYSSHKIYRAIQKAMTAVDIHDYSVIDDMISTIENKFEENHIYTVEEIQDIVEETLMLYGYYSTAKSYILYRQKKSEERKSIQELYDMVQDSNIIKLLGCIPKYGYRIETLKDAYKKMYKENDKIGSLLQACISLIDKEAPNWEFIASRIANVQLEQEIIRFEKEFSIHSYYDKICFLIDLDLYGSYLLDHYTKEEIDQLESYMNPERTNLLNYSGLELLKERYLMKTHDKRLVERVQEMFMSISLHMAMLEKDRVFWAKKFYDILSNLYVTMATPTISNARRPFHQMSSCFIDTVSDSLQGIYKSLDNFAQVSKHGGGMGLYFGKVRANQSSIRGFKGAAGGVVRWIKLVNDTAIAVDQLGVRQGAAAVYLDVWHKDLPEFLQMKTNNGDDRMKAHDIFPGICYPDLFWKMANENLEGDWYLFCPHEIYQHMGYHLEDFYGEEWEKRYWQCVREPSLHKRVIPLKEILRLIIKSLVETGTPFTFNRDHVNRMNPNSHKGMIYCSNLCTEIAQNMSSMEQIEEKIMIVNDEQVVVNTTKPGDFVVCNLASLSLGHIPINDHDRLREIIHTVVRALDNVIDLNFYPIPYAKITNQKYRAIGLGVSGYHHMLAKQHIPFESEEHYQFVDSLFETINYYTIEASMTLSKEKGHYSFFEGSQWQTGEYFEKRGYTSQVWNELRKHVQQYGLRNGYLLAIAPTSSTSLIAGTTAGIDPILNKFYLEEKKGSMIPRVAPSLDPSTYWIYKNAHLILQDSVIRAAGIRQRHIDQSQALNLFITNSFTYRSLLHLLIYAWQNQVKTIYYVRSQSLEIEECESCSA